MKIWFQNRRTKWKKQNNISNAEAAEHKNSEKKDEKEDVTERSLKKPKAHTIRNLTYTYTKEEEMKEEATASEEKEGYDDGARDDLEANELSYSFAQNKMDRERKENQNKDKMSVERTDYPLAMAYPPEIELEDISSEPCALHDSNKLQPDDLIRAEIDSLTNTDAFFPYDAHPNNPPAEENPAFR